MRRTEGIFGPKGAIEFLGLEEKRRTRISKERRVHKTAKTFRKKGMNLSNQIRYKMKAWSEMDLSCQKFEFRSLGRRWE